MITKEEYKARREEVLKKMSPMSIAILPAGEQKYRNADTEYPFRQESHFYYLTGFSEPDALLILKKATKKEESEFIFFCRAEDKEAQKWVGKRLGPEGAVTELGANRAYTMAELPERLP